MSVLLCDIYPSCDVKKGGSPQAYRTKGKEGRRSCAPYRDIRLSGASQATERQSVKVGLERWDGLDRHEAPEEEESR
jgi:hypothetical protein